MKRVLIVLAAMLFVLPAAADEGMWLLPYLNKLNIKDMKAKGLKLSAEDIYSVNRGSLKDAIVIFGGGCTGEVVSAEGLLLTNHHCGYGNIQALSSIEHDYLKNGFWAMSRAEEIPAPGLAVTFIRRMEDVTAEVLGAAADMGVGQERDGVVAQNRQAVTLRYEGLYPQYDIEVRSFMGGNQYFAIVSEKFADVRLVGTPPNSMGKFGGDTDNWMWPRHTDDFSMFRIYAGPDNRPAAYSPDNRPYNAPTHLKVSLKGVKENDFTMIMGFPGSTDRYMTTYEMRHLIEVENANRIFVRGERQAILMEDMLADDAVRLKYSAKYASSSNYWKNSIGKNKALEDNGIPEEKAALEARFAAWAAGPGAASAQRYAEALPMIAKTYEEGAHTEGLFQFLREALYSGVEIMTLPARVKAVAKTDAEGKLTNKDEVMAAVGNFYKNYNEPTDRRAAKRMVAITRDRVAAADLPPFFAEIDSRFGGDTDKFVDNLYDNTAFTAPERLSAALDRYGDGAIGTDPATQIAESLQGTLAALAVKLTPVLREREAWYRVYIKGLTEMDKGGKFYPDANFSMRLTYGQVLPYEPRDGVLYKYYTTIEGVLQKEDPSNPLEFTVPARLKDLHAAGDYGRYGEGGTLVTDFLSNNDITGGNSGSPVLNARGELIGLAFDGNWEAMSGDVVFEPKLQRCINVDIRYVLWTIDKFAGAGHLVEEMTIAK